MKTILTILGSPIRHGNTAKLADMLEAELATCGDYAFERVNLADAGLKMCLGCHSCIVRGEEHCPLKDGRDTLLSKMENAHGIILLTPVYCMQVSSLMKLFIDHLAFLWHRPRLFGKKVLVGCCGAGAGPVASPALDYMALNASRWGARPVARVSVMRFDTKLTPKAQANQERSVAVAARKFSRALDKGDNTPSLTDLFWFNIWREAAKTGENTGSVDYLYWKKNGWLDPETEFFRPSHIAFWKRAAIRLSGMVFGLVTRQTYAS